MFYCNTIQHSTSLLIVFFCHACCVIWLWPLVIWVPGALLPSPTSLPSVTSDPAHQRRTLLLALALSGCCFLYLGLFSVVCQSPSGSAVCEVFSPARLAPTTMFTTFKVKSPFFNFSKLSSPTSLCLNALSSCHADALWGSCQQATEYFTSNSS